MKVIRVNQVKMYKLKKIIFFVKYYKHEFYYERSIAKKWS